MISAGCRGWLSSLCAAQDMGVMAEAQCSASCPQVTPTEPFHSLHPCAHCGPCILCTPCILCILFVPCSFYNPCSSLHPSEALQPTLHPFCLLEPLQHFQPIASFASLAPLSCILCTPLHHLHPLCPSQPLIPSHLLNPAVALVSFACLAAGASVHVLLSLTPCSHAGCTIGCYEHIPQHHPALLTNLLCEQCRHEGPRTPPPATKSQPAPP